MRLAARPDLDDVVGRARERTTLLGSRLPVESILADRDADRR